MDLAKPHLDIGLFTNRLEPMLRFYQRGLALPFDHMQPLGGGVRQHRHDLLGSVLKINHSRNPLPESGRSGYVRLIVAREDMPPAALADPDDNRIDIVRPGYCGVSRVGIVVAARDVGRHRRFLTEALGAVPVANGERRAFRIGDSVLILEPDTIKRDPTYPALGFCYLTIQVFDVDSEHAAALKAGGAEGAAPRTLGSVARISFVRDPDGNFIEISQRASVTGTALPEHS